MKQLIDEENSILLYKPYGSPVVHGPPEIDKLPNSKDLFMLGIQTDRQKRLMEELAGKIVVVDETHGTNAYKYQLLTVLVVDDNRRGWPVGHLITSKSDAQTLQFFFKCLKINTDVDINCVITDDDAALINAMNLGFSEQVRHLLCIWHFESVGKEYKSQPNCGVCKYNGPAKSGQFICVKCKIPVHPSSGCSVNRQGTVEQIPGDSFRQCFSCFLGKYWC